MTLLVCTIAIVVNAGGGINVSTTADVEGKLIKEGYSKYIVDFRDGLKKYPKVVNPQNYEKTLVNKSDCVVE